MVYETLHSEFSFPDGQTQMKVININFLRFHIYLAIYIYIYISLKIHKLISKYND